MKKIMLVLVFCMICAVMSGCSSSSNSVDLDLSKMSSTVVYSQIYNMWENPEQYVVKNVKMAGCYTYSENPELGIVYHACYVPDSTACCTQFLEFIRPDGYNWPADYPEADANIVVTGRLETYEENGVTYLTLADAKLEWQKD